jgi:sec-independent protein translocase protein TatA
MDTICASLAFIDGVGTPEMMLIFVLVLVLFGGQKLPEFARGLGKTMREVKKAASGVEEEFKRALEEDERKSNAAQLAASSTPQLLSASETPAHDEHGYGGGPAPATTADASTAAATTPATTATMEAAGSTTEPAAAPAVAAEATPAPPTPATPPPPAPPKRARPNPTQLPDYL